MGRRPGRSGRGTQFSHAVYFSGSAIFTVVSNEARNPASKVLTVVESGLGISFLGLVVGYLPVLYQSFSGRELHISMLDARAGSPPSAGMLLARQGAEPEKLADDMARWEEWAAEILEGHLSYPMLAYFRSQHPNQSWLSALTAILDVSAIVLVCSKGSLHRQAILTFAMSRHAVVDLARIFGQAPTQQGRERLGKEEADRLVDTLRRERVALDLDRFSLDELGKLTAMYESYTNGLSRYFLIALPGWMPDHQHRENWRATSWDLPDETFTVSDPFLDQRRRSS